MARRGPFLAVIAALALAVLVPDASAHAVLARSVPADGSRLARAPDVLRLRFSEAISPRFRVVRVIDGRGRAVAGTRVRADGARGLLVTVPRLRRGAYQVVWEVLADDDGHVTGGTLAFGVAVRSVAARDAGPAGAAPAFFEAALRSLDLALLVGLIGALAMSALLGRLDPRVSGTARRRLLEVAVVAASAGAVLGLLLLARQTDRIHATVAPGASAGDVLATRWGVLWLAREALLTTLTATALWLHATVADHAASTAAARGEPRRAAAWRAWRAAARAADVLRRVAPRRPRAASQAADARRVAPRGSLAAREWLAAPLRSRVAAGLAAVLLIALALVRALGGHAAAAPRPGLAVAAASAHLLAAGVWIGGVVAFGVALATARDGAGALTRACRGPFARVAGLSVAVLAITGLLAAGAQVASVDALLTTDYGRTLITKSLLVAAAVGLGLANARALRRGSLPRLLRVEAAAGAGVLLAAAVLTASPPAKGPEFAAPRPAMAPALARQAGDLLVTATARPNRAGPNVFSVLAVSSRRPPPAPVSRAELRLTPPGGGPERSVVLTALAPGRFAGGAELEADGRWRMTAVITRGTRRIAVPFSWALAAPDPARPVTYSARPLAPVLDRAAVVLALLLGSVAAAAVGLRRTGGRSLIEPLGKEAS